MHGRTCAPGTAIQAALLLVRLFRHSDDSCPEHRAVAYSDGKSVSLRFGSRDLGAAGNCRSLGVDALPPVSCSARWLWQVWSVGWLVWLGFQTTQFNRDLEEQRTVLDHVIDQDFYNEIAHYNLGLHYINQSNVNRAGIEFWHSLAIHPKYHLALSGIGGYYFDKGQTELARQKFHAALNASPDFDVAINNLGRVYAEMGKLQRALYFFYRATYVNPNNIRALSNIAVAYQRINKLDALEEIAGVIIQRFPEAPEGFFRLGMCREAQGRFPEAISAWEESLKRAVAGDPLIQQIESRLGPVRAKVSNSAPHLPQYDR